MINKKKGGSYSIYGLIILFLIVIIVNILNIKNEKSLRLSIIWVVGLAGILSIKIYEKYINKQLSGMPGWEKDELELEEYFRRVFKSKIDKKSALAALKGHGWNQDLAGSFYDYYAKKLKK